MPFRISGGLTWISPKFTSFPNCLTSVQQGGAPSTFASCTGNQIPLAAKFSGNVGGDYVLQMGTGSLDLNGNVYDTSGFYPESDNKIKQNRYALINASLRYTFERGFSIGVYGKNLTNRRVISFESSIPNGTHLNTWQAPRTYGVTAGFKF